MERKPGKVIELVRRRITADSWDLGARSMTPAENKYSERSSFRLM